MKKKAIGIFVATVLAFTLGGCGKDTSPSMSQNDDTAAAIQFTFDMSTQAQAYTDKLFESMLSEKGITKYKIESTSGGFITGDPVSFISGYRYTYDGKEDVYGYKLSLNDDGTTFTVLEESVDAGEFIVGHTD